MDFEDYEGEFDAEFSDMTEFDPRKADEELCEMTERATAAEARVKELEERLEKAKAVLRHITKPKYGFVFEITASKMAALWAADVEKARAVLAELEVGE